MPRHRNPTCTDSLPTMQCRVSEQLTEYVTGTRRMEKEACVCTNTIIERVHQRMPCFLEPHGAELTLDY